MRKSYFYIAALILWLIFLQVICKFKEDDLFKAGVSWILVGIFFELCSINKNLKE